MPRKIQAPGPRPRPRRALGATAKRTVPPPNPNSSSVTFTAANSPDNGGTETTSQSAPEIAVLPSSSSPPSSSIAITAGIVEKSTVEQQQQQNSSMETQGERISSGNEILAEENLNENENSHSAIDTNRSGVEEKCGGGETQNGNVIVTVNVNDLVLTSQDGIDLNEPIDSVLTSQDGIDLNEPIVEIGNANEGSVTEKKVVVVKKKKKVVKVVKRLVKKRVPKVVQKGLAVCSSKEKGEVLDDGSEQIISVDSVSQPMQDVVKNNLNEGSEDKGVEIFDRDGEKKKGSNVFVPLQEVGKIDSLVCDPIEVENSDVGMAVLMGEDENPDQAVSVSMEVENLKTMEVCEEGKECSVSEIQVEGENSEGIVEKANSATEMPVEAVNVVSAFVEVEHLKTMEVCGVGGKECSVSCGVGGKECSVSEIPVDGKNNEGILDESKSNSPTEMPVKAVNVDLVGDRNDKCRAEVVGVSSGDNKGGKEKVKGDDGEIGNERVVLSGELEALERRRRRKTEIFIGGLSTDAKEEDVRKVFEEIGEIVEVRLVINSMTGKNKGFAFVKYASAADTQKALEKLPKAEICGKQCATAPVEGNDTIFLGNIDKKWKNEDVIKLLQEIGIEKIDKVTVMIDPNNTGRNRGFAFLELKTNKDAQIAFKKLQKKDALGLLQNAKVAWARPLSEPDEEELLKVKSVYAEYLPLSWDEEKVRNYFKKFGEIEDVVLAQNLHSSRRKDFAFINFRTREDALACIESCNHEVLTDEGSKVNVKVSLAKPLPKHRPHKKVFKSTSVGPPKQNLKATQRPIRPIEPRNKGMSATHFNNYRTSDKIPPSNSELEHLLAERALWKQTQARLGLTNPDYSCTLPGRKRSISALGDDLYCSDPRRYTHMHVENSFLVRSPSDGEVPSGVGLTSYSHNQLQHADYSPGYRYTKSANSFEREEAPYRGRGSLHYRY